MQSPFPGMDPYMERTWGDAHTKLITYVGDELQPQLSDDLVARVQETVFIEDGTYRRPAYPDEDVVLSGKTPISAAPRANLAVLDRPIVLQRSMDPIIERSVLIYDAEGNQVVTAIEILSPRNKKRAQAGGPI